MIAGRVALAAGVGVAGFFAFRAFGASLAPLPSADDQFTRAEIRTRVQSLLRRHRFPAVDALHLRTIVEIESNRKPRVFRYEALFDDFSAGLTQTLVATAADMYDRGWRAYSRPAFADDDARYARASEIRIVNSPARILYNADASLYFGAAYIQWLSAHSLNDGTLQWLTRAYNGGPRGGTRSSTEYYWFDRYLPARARLINFDKGG